MIWTKARENKTATEKGSEEGYLEVTVREGTSEANVAQIIQALATISNFFGVRLDKGGGGGGGGSSIMRMSLLKGISQKSRSRIVPTPPKPSIPRTPFNVPRPPSPPRIGPDSRIGG